jgi:hypothetical protein
MCTCRLIFNHFSVVSHVLRFCWLGSTGNKFPPTCKKLSCARSQCVSAGAAQSLAVAKASRASAADLRQQREGVRDSGETIRGESELIQVSH